MLTTLIYIYINQYSVANLRICSTCIGERSISDNRTLCEIGILFCIITIIYIIYITY